MVENNLEKVNESISAILSDRNKKFVNDFMEKDEDGLDGKNQAKLWKLRNKLCPKNNQDKPSAKKDPSGNLITDREALEELYLNTYVERLKPNPIEDNMRILKYIRKNLHISLVLTDII